MAETAASTAFGPMVIVAAEQTLPESQRILTDAVAYKLLPHYMKWMADACRIGFIQRGFFNLLEKATPGIYTGMVCRKRYIEDRLTETLKAGLDSIVILGAGLDTLAYRLPEVAKVRVYEVDLPKNIAYKKRTLERLFGGVPAHVTLVPTDFEDQRLDTVLKAAGYDFDQRTFFVWEGVTQYLTEAAVRDTLDVLTKAKTGSRMIFTYVRKDFIDGQNMYESEGLYQRFRVKSLVWLYGLAPDKIAGFIGEYGWNEVEQVGADEMTAHYVKPRGRTTPISEIERTVYAQKA